MSVCPGKETEVQQRAMELYEAPENREFAYQAAAVEGEFYGQLCRMEEIVEFSRRMGYRKIGLIFCIALKNEAKTVDRILRANGFEVCSAICKNGSHPKRALGISDAQSVSGCADEAMCNPIAQALLMNQEGTDFNVLLGLCVGHDSLAIKYLDAPVTVLAVKDRVTGHNPMGPIYLADGPYIKKFFG